MRSLVKNITLRYALIFIILNLMNQMTRLSNQEFSFSFLHYFSWYQKKKEKRLYIFIIRSFTDFHVTWKWVSENFRKKLNQNLLNLIQHICVASNFIFHLPFVVVTMCLAIIGPNCYTNLRINEPTWIKHTEMKWIRIKLQRVPFGAIHVQELSPTIAVSANK